jgi:carbon-monoxide dehydrogenase small subunit
MKIHLSAVVLYVSLQNSIVTSTADSNGDTKMEINITLNGETKQFEAAKTDSLLDTLRKNGYTGAKRGCDTGACGFCTVIIDGEPVNSCVTPAAKADGATVQTIEGLGNQSDLHPVQAAFVDHSALQCGFCIPGMIMRSKALLDENPTPTEAEVREGLSDNLCRCTGYKKIVEAVLDAADRMDESSQTPVATDGGHADASDIEDGECCGKGGGCQ